MLLRLIAPLVVLSTVACGGKTASSALQDDEISQISNDLYTSLKTQVAADAQFIPRTKALGAHYYSELFLAQDWLHPDLSSPSAVKLSQLVHDQIKPISKNLTALDHIGTIATIIERQNGDLDSLSRSDVASSVRHLNQLFNSSGNSLSLDEQPSQKAIAVGIKLAVFMQSAELSKAAAKGTSLSLTTLGGAGTASETAGAAATRLGGLGRISRSDAARSVAVGDSSDENVLAILGSDFGALNKDARQAAYDKAVEMITNENLVLQNKLANKQIVLTEQQIKESQNNVAMTRFTKKAQYISWALGGVVIIGTTTAGGFTAYNAIKSNENKGH